MSKQLDKTSSSTSRRSLKEKYTKKSPEQLLNGDNIKLVKYRENDVEKLKEKYSHKISKAQIPFDDEFLASVKANQENKMVKSPNAQIEETIVSPKVNAFQFMMNSRHKVIGSNSPGKEKKPEPTKTPEDVAAKKDKLKKRKATFGELAEKKGGQKRKLADEAQEEHIKKTMKERAKRLKKMLEIIDEDLRNSSHDESDHEVKSDELNINNQTPKRSNRRSEKNAETKNNDTPESKTDVPNNTVEDNNNQNENNEDSNAATTKSTKSAKKTIANLSLKKNKKSLTPETGKKTEPESTNEQVNNNGDSNEFPVNTPGSNRKTRQLKLFQDTNKKKIEEESVPFSPRSWKMKVRLLEKENINEGTDEDAENVIVDDNNTPKKPSIQGKISTFFGSPATKTENKKDVKLAPLFVKQQSKKQIKAELEAKKKFLYSGMPEQVKKVAAKQQSINEIEFEIFPKISHVQQRTSIDGTLHIFWDLPNPSLILVEKKIESITNFSFDDTFTYGTLTACLKHNTTKITNKQVYSFPTKLPNLKEYITTLKQEYPDHPVFKMFRLLYEKYTKYNNKIESSQVNVTPNPINKRRGRPKKSKPKPEIPIPMEIKESQMWTEKYKPLCQDDIIGNYTSVKQLKSWLQSWLHYSEDQKQLMKKRKRANSSSDDFCHDSDTRDTAERLPQNMIILVGPVGTGKTASVYALCNELNINVIEINASSKRTGKRILTELQEATQSHQVKNTDSKSVTSFFQKKSDTSNEPTREEENKKMSLLLMEDVDIVFEDQDDGFISALSTLQSSSKRPIILTTSDKNCLHLQKLFAQHDVIDFSAISSRVASPWLQILCLIEGIQTDRVMIDRLLEWNKGDVRKTILQLQFWVQSGGDSSNVSSSNLLENNLRKSILDEHGKEPATNDESSNLSWFESDSKINDTSRNIHKSCVECFTSFYEKDNVNFKLEFPINLGNLWWNLPSILNINSIEHNEIFKTTESSLSNNEKEMDNQSDVDCSLNATKYMSDSENSMDNPESSHLLDLKSVGDFLETLAFTDTLYVKSKSHHTDFQQPTCQFWQTNPVNSLLLTENYEMYNEANNLSHEIAQWLVEQNIQKCIKKLGNCGLDVNVALPNQEERRWISKIHKSMEGVTDLIPPSCLLDRIGICQDYFPLMRTICRMENIRFATNNKRKNRFYHYFKTFNIHLSDTTNLVLCNSLAIKNYY